MKKNFFKSIAIAMSLMAPCVATMAQSDEEVLRYSAAQTSGTARSMALGGATGAMGADYSAMSFNPAGLALYRNSEMIFTPGVFTHNSNSSYFGNTSNDRKYKFSLDNIGFVFKNNYKINGKPVTKGWSGVAFGFGYQKLNNFNLAYNYNGFNRTSSIGDKYVADVNGRGILAKNLKNTEPFGAGVAYESYLIDPSATDTTIYVNSAAGGHVMQQNASDVKGSSNEIQIAFAGNYEDRIFVGATLGIPIINYKKQTTYSESNDSMYHADFTSFVQKTTINQSGAGINLKLGSIFRINDYVRLGLAVHSPTLYSITDKGRVEMTTTRPSYGTHTDTSNNEIDYTITTPFKVLANAAFMVQKYGFVTLDYELMDYSQGFIKFSSTNPGDIKVGQTINNTLKNAYTMSHTIKIGAEAKFNIFSVRAGYAYNSTPFKTAVVKSNNLSAHTISIGAGIRDKTYFVDGVISRSYSHSIDLPYIFNNTNTASPVALIDNVKTYVGVSVGFKF